MIIKSMVLSNGVFKNGVILGYNLHTNKIDLNLSKIPML